MEIKWYLFLAIVLFVLGITGVLTRRNSVIVLMSIELMLNSANLLLVAFSKMHVADRVNSFSGYVSATGQLFVLFVMIVSLAEVAIGLAIIAVYYKRTKSVDINFLNRLKN